MATGAGNVQRGTATDWRKAHAPRMPIIAMQLQMRRVARSQPGPACTISTGRALGMGILATVDGIGTGTVPYRTTVPVPVPVQL